MAKPGLDSVSTVPPEQGRGRVGAGVGAVGEEVVGNGDGAVGACVGSAVGTSAL